MRILILGAGAIGGVTAAFLAQNHHDVTLLCNRERAAETIRTRGLHITGKRGDFYAPVKAVASPSQLEGSYDYIFFITKAYDLQAAAQSVLPYLANDGLAVSFQNGICYEELAAVVGIARTAVSIVSFSSTMLADAELEFTGEGGFVIGRPDGMADDRLHTLQQILSCVCPTRISSDILGEMYAKLIINSGIACGGAITGQTLGQMLRGTTARRFFIAIVREDMKLAEALGIRVPPFGGKLDYYAFLKGNGPLASLRRHLTLFAVGLRYRRLTSSSLTALQRGRKTEVQYQNGWIVRRAAEHAIPTPVNDRVVQMIHEIEQGTRSIRPQNLRELMTNRKD